MEPQSSKTLLMELGRSQTQQAGKQNRAFMTALRHSFKYDSLAANADVTSDDDMAASPPADERRQTLPRELSGPMGSGKGPPKLEREEFKVQHLSRVQSRRESRRSATLTRGRLSVAWQDESEPRRSSERGGERRRPASESSGVRVLRQSLTSEFGTSAESIDLRDRRKSGSSGVSRSAAQRSGGSENCWTEESENRLSEVSEPVFKRSDRSRSGWSANSLSKESETGRIEQPENSRGKRFDSDNRRSESSVKGRSKRPGSRPSEGSENGLFREPSRTGLPVRSADSVSGSGLRTASAPGDRSADGVKLPVLVQVGRFEHTNSRKASTPLVLESVLSNIASNAHENEAEQTATAPLQTIARTGEGGFRNRAWVPEFEPLASLVQSPGAKVPRLQLPGGVVSKGDRVNESGWLEWRILAELRAKAVKDVKERAGSPEFYREVRKESKHWVDAKEAEFKRELHGAFPGLLEQREEEFLETHLHIISESKSAPLLLRHIAHREQAMQLEAKRLFDWGLTKVHAKMKRRLMKRALAELSNNAQNARTQKRSARSMGGIKPEPEPEPEPESDLYEEWTIQDDEENNSGAIGTASVSRPTMDVASGRIPVRAGHRNAKNRSPKEGRLLGRSGDLEPFDPASGVAEPFSMVGAGAKVSQTQEVSNEAESNGTAREISLEGNGLESRELDALHVSSDAGQHLETGLDGGFEVDVAEWALEGVDGLGLRWFEEGAQPDRVEPDVRVTSAADTAAGARTTLAQLSDSQGGKKVVEERGEANRTETGARGRVSGAERPESAALEPESGEGSVPDSSRNHNETHYGAEAPSASKVALTKNEIEPALGKGNASEGFGWERETQGGPPPESERPESVVGEQAERVSGAEDEFIAADETETSAERPLTSWGFQPGFGVRTRAESRRSSRRVTRGIRTAPAPSAAAALLDADVRRASESVAVRPLIDKYESPVQPTEELRASVGRVDTTPDLLTDSSVLAQAQCETAGGELSLADDLEKELQEKLDTNCNVLTEASLEVRSQRQVAEKLSRLVQLSYLAKCSELDIVPLSRLRSQVRNPLCNLAHCQLGPKHGQALAFCLQVNPTVTALNLEDNELGSDTVRQLVDSVVGTKRITELDLSRNEIGWEGARALERLLENAPAVGSPETVKTFLRAFESRRSTQSGGVAEPSNGGDVKADERNWKMYEDERVFVEDVYLGPVEPTSGTGTVTESGVTQRCGDATTALTTREHQRPPGIPAVVRLGSPAGIPAVVPLVPTAERSGSPKHDGIPVRSSVRFAEGTGGEASRVQPAESDIPFAFENDSSGGTDLALRRNASSERTESRSGDGSMENGWATEMAPRVRIDGSEEDEWPLEPHEWVDTASLRRLTDVELTEDDTWHEPEAPPQLPVAERVAPKKKVKMLVRVSGNSRRFTRRKTSMGPIPAATTLLESPEAEPKLETPVDLTMLPVLNRLVLTGCNIGNRGASCLAEVLSANRSLTYLGLAGNEIGDQGACALGSMLFKNDTLLELDLSWNMVKALGTQAISLGLENNRALRVLNLDWNGLEDEGCQFLGIMLTSKRALANLRLNHTRCGPAGALLLAEGVARNVTLKRLELKGNPIGDDGGRHLLTALQSNKVLETIQMEGSNLSVKSHGQERFNFKSPEGHYKLNLANPVDRAVASRLCALDAQSAAAAAAAGSDKASRPQSPDTPEELRAPVAAPVSCWRDAKLNNCPVKGTPGAKKWPEKMPKKGVLEFDYVAFRGGHSQAELTPLDQKDLEDLCEQLSRATVSNFERLSFVRLFASSCYFRSQQAARLLQTFNPGEERVRASVLLFCRLVDMEEFDAVLGVMIRQEQRQAVDRLGVHYYFRQGNPTGHYELSLVLQTDAMMAAKLLELAVDEGARLNWRNVQYRGRVTHAAFGAPEEWGHKVPNQGVLRFDYTSFVPPPAAAQPLPDDDLRAFLARAGVDDAEKATELRVSLLRAHSTKLWLTSDQAVALVRMFSRSDERVEVAVIAYARILDKRQFWKVLYELNGVEHSYATYRLGFPVVFDKKHITMHYRLDCNNPEHRAIAQRLVGFAQRSPNYQTWHNVMIGGKRMRSQLVEDNTMWSVLTTTSFEPLIEFDMVGPDFFELVGQPQLATSDDDDKQKVQREALLRDHANRIALSRARAFHPYWLEFLQKRARAQTGGRSAAGSVASVTLFGKSPGASTARAQTAGARSAGTSLDAKLTSGTRVSKAPAESSLADVTSSLADAARGGRVLEDPRVSARLSETPRTKVSFGDGPRPASGIDGGAEPARPRSALWRTENARARPPSRELRFEDAQGKRESIMEEADGEETASAPLAENRSADGSNLDRNDGQKSEGPGERQSDQAGLRKSSEGFAASFDGKSAGLRNGETRTPSRLKTEDGLAAEPVEEPGLVSGPDGGIQTLDALTPTSRRSSSWLPRNNSLRTSSVVSSRYIATLFDIGATESTDEPFEPLDWAESQSNGAEWAPPTHWSENRRSRPSSREASGGDAAGARPRSRGFGGSDRSDSPSRPGSRGRMAGGGVNADGGVNTGGGVSADGGVNAFGVANTESGKTAAAGSVNVLGDVNTPRSRQSGRKSSSGHNIVKAGANVEKENVDAGEGGRSASVNKHGRPSSREAEGVPAESLYPKDDYPSESEPLADSKVDPERAHREKLFKSKSRSKSRSRHDRGKRSGKSTGHSPQNYLPSTNRKFPWQLRWDALMRASVALEARAFPEGTCPLRILYESMRKEGEPRVALDGLKKGMRQLCGLRLTPAHVAKLGGRAHGVSTADEPLTSRSGGESGSSRPASHGQGPASGIRPGKAVPAEEKGLGQKSGTPETSRVPSARSRAPTDDSKGGGSQMDSNRDQLFVDWPTFEAFVMELDESLLSFSKG